MAHDKELADRPAHNEKEIEVTPEMIEAGLREYYAGNTDFDSAESIVERIFISMVEIGKEEADLSYHPSPQVVP